MNEEKIIEALARVEDEATLFARGVEGAIGFNMDSWVHFDQGWQIVDFENERDERNDFNSEWCGTTACLAGHVVLMEGFEVSQNGATLKDGRSVEDVAADILGLDLHDGGSTETAPFYESDLNGVYRWIANHLEMDETVLREKVAAERKYA